MRVLLHVLLFSAAFLGSHLSNAQCTNVTLQMFDSFGDGWNGAVYTITNVTGAPFVVATGDLDFPQTGDGLSTGTDVLCLPDGCYSITVGGGLFDGEITWNLLGADGGALSGGAPQTALFSINTSCNSPSGYDNPGGTINTCSGNFYDSGGAVGNHFNNEYVVTTFCPDQPDVCIQMDFSFINLESCCDALTIYDGGNTGSPVIGTYTGTNSPGVVTATSGCLTFVFSSDFSITYPGWEASISCVACPVPPPPPDPVDFEVGCPDIDLGADIALPMCTTPCETLTLDATYFETGETTTYQVNSIPFNPPYPFNTGTQFSINIDDVWSETIALPFNFCYFGNMYSDIIVGSNGLISFDLASAGGYCPWPFTAACPSPALPVNSIFGVYHDIDPAVCGAARYAILGTAPCRQFVVNYDQLCHYSFDCNSMISTTQIVLYETTNTIEVYVQDKPTCTTWNSGNALIGIQNATGTVGYTPPGRNTGPWSASDEAWRFTPNGSSIVDVNWYSQQDGFLGTGANMDVCPDETSQTYVAEAVYSLCDGSTITVSDNVVVTCAQILLPVEWLSFDAKLFADDRKVLCEWSTASESNNHHFEVQRSDDTIMWESVGTVEGAGTSQEVNAYSLVDHRPLGGVSYYRVIQVDNNGQKSPSEIRSVERQTVDLVISPNPGNGKFRIMGVTGGKLRVFDARGREVPFVFDRMNTLTLQGVSQGTYFIEWAPGQGIAPVRERVIVQ